MIIAVDGPTASGKGTIARALSAHFGLPHLDTGLLYRAVGWQVAQDGGDPDCALDALAATAFTKSLLDDPRLRTETAGGLASRVAVHPEVRRTLYDRQRRFAMQEGGAVLDGRDIATVIAPDATIKLFVTASLEARARRRWAELQPLQPDLTLEAVAADIARRDSRDQERAEAPLMPGRSSLLLDTSAMGKDEAIARAIELVRGAGA